MPVSPREVIMLAFTGLLGMKSWPRVAKIDSTWAAAYIQLANFFPCPFRLLTFALMVSVVGLGLSMVSHSWW
jgi:hypothetical protein